MAAFNFPNSPSTNDLHTENNVTWKWNGTVWKRINNSYLTASTLDVSGIGTFGRALIGTTTVGEATADDLTIATSGSTGITIRSGTGNAGNIQFGDGTSGDDQLRGIVQYHHSDNSMRFSTNASEKLRITSAGSVGINSTSPDRRFTLHQDATCRMNLKSLANSTAGIEFGDEADHNAGYIVYDNTDNSFQVGLNAGEKVRITSDGRLWLGISSWAGHASCDDLIIGDGSGHRGLTVYSGSSNDGGLYFADGTSSNASYRGIIAYEHANDAMAFRTGAVERLRITSAGRMGIGESSPDTTLHINGGSSNNVLKLESTDGTCSMEFYDNATTNGNQPIVGGIGNNFYVETGGSERLRIDSSGRVLVSTTTEGHGNADELTLSYNNTGVSGGDQGRCGLTIRSGQNTSSVMQNGYIYFSDGTSGGNEYRGVVGYNHNSDYLYFSSAATERLRITSAGDFGTNGVTPTTQAGRVFHLHAGATQQRFHMTNNTTGSGATDGFEIIVEESANVRIRNFEAGALMFDTGGSNNEAMRITSAGKVLIGTTTPQGNANADDLTVYSNGHAGITIRSATSSNGNLFFADGISGGDEYRGWVTYDHSNNRLTFGTNAAERLRLDANGNLMLGTTTPTLEFTVRGGGSVAAFEGTGGNVALMLIDVDNSKNLFLQNANGVYQIQTAGSSYSTKLAVTEAGQVRLPINGQELTWGSSQQIKFFYDNSEERMYLQGDGAYGMAFRVNSGNRLEINKTTGDVSMQGASGRNFNWDNSDASLYLTDSGSSSARLKIGTGGDLQMYHDAGSSLNLITCANNQELKVSANKHTFYDYTGVTKRFEVDANGYVLKPKHPYFVAQKSAVITSTGYVTFNTVIHNNGSHYSGGNGKFTAPVAGAYWIYCKVNAYKRCDFQLRVNGNSNGNTVREIGQWNTSNHDGWWSVNMSRIFVLSANDYVQVYISNITQNSDPGEWLTFQGYLIG